jgi:8-oxo-dGTP diphosphatase
MSLSKLAQRTHLGAYGIIVDRNDRLLLIMKSRGPYTGLFDLPGGKIEYGEQPEDALRREILEETGLSLNQFRSLEPHIHYGEYDDWELAPKASKRKKIHFQHVGLLFKITDTTKVKDPPKNDEDVVFSKWIELEGIDLERLAPMAQFAVRKYLTLE